jgi:parallel beta-helix repeat protein
MTRRHLRTPTLGAILAGIWLLTAGTASAQTTYYLTNFGAQCNGTANDWQYIQDALDAVKNGDILEFPAGQVCLFDQTLSIEDGISFVLEGNGATLKLTAGATQGLTIFRSHGYTIRNLTLDGSREVVCPSSQEDPSCWKDLLLIRGSTREFPATGETVLPSTLSNVSALRSARAGIRIRGLTMAHGGEDNVTTDITLTACTALENQINGLVIGEAERIDVLGGTFAETGSSLLLLPGAGIDIENESSEAVDDILISGAKLRDNYGNGIQLGQSSGGVTNGVTITGSTFSGNRRGAIRVRASNITIEENTFEDSDEASSDQDGSINIFFDADTVTIDDNIFRRFSTGQPVIHVDPATSGVDPVADSVTISNNTFEDINVTAGIGAAIHDESDGTAVTGNDFHDLGDRGVWATGVGATIAGNTFSCMRGNAIWAADDDAVIDDNILGPPASACSMAAADAVIRARGDGGTINGNTLVCLGTTQRGIVLDENPDEVKDNNVTNCDPNRWLQFLSGQGSTVVNGNVRSTATVTACTP